MLELIGVLLVLVLALVVRAGAPKGKPVSLRTAWLSLALNIGAFLGAELVRYAAFQSILGALAIAFIALALARLTFLFLFDVLLARNRTRPLPRIVRDISQGAILLVAALMSLRSAGVEPGQLLTTSALLTVVAGMALQETLGNLVAGLAIQTERPFEVGDWIEVHGTPGHIGQVREINWRATRLHTLDNVDVVVPNGLLAKATFTNFDRPHGAPRRSVYFHCSGSTPTRRVHEVVMEAIHGCPGVLEEPAPSLVTSGFNEAGVQYWLRFYITDMSRRDSIDGGVRDRVWYALARHGLPLSPPTRAVFLHEVSDETEKAKADRALEDRSRALARIELFQPLSREELLELASRVRTLIYGPGEVVIRQGERGDTMFVVRRGELSVRVGGVGAEAEAARLPVGAFFGEMSLLTGDPRKATVVAVSPCELLEIDHEAFHALLGAHPGVAAAIGQKVMQRAQGLQAREGSLDASDPGSGGEDPAENDLVNRIRRFFGLG